MKIGKCPGFEGLKVGMSAFRLGGRSSSPGGSVAQEQPTRTRHNNENEKRISQSASRQASKAAGGKRRGTNEVAKSRRQNGSTNPRAQSEIGGRQVEVEPGR